jgi:hypothetical protein
MNLQLGFFLGIQCMLSKHSFGACSIGSYIGNLHRRIPVVLNDARSIDGLAFVYGSEIHVIGRRCQDFTRRTCIQNKKRRK